MRRPVTELAFLFSVTGAVAVACGGDDSVSTAGSAPGDDDAGVDGSATGGFGGTAGSGATGGSSGGTGAAGGADAAATGGAAGTDATAPDAGTGGGLPIDAGPSCNLDGVVDPGEQCDDGDTDDTNGCTDSCTFTCEANVDCNDGNPCNGDETCDTAANTCNAGTAPADGTDCGTGLSCVGGICISSSCGDGVTQGGEECDDGDVDPDNGCDNACNFSCVSTDSSRDCSLSDECQGTSTCDDSTHTCSTPTPLSDDAACTSSSGAGYCSSAVCVNPTCGDGNPEPGETCDDGDTDETNGCTTACAFSCTANSDCNDANFCTRNVCNQTTHVCSNPPNPNRNGASCSSGGVSGTCQNGVCTPAACGDSTVDSNEDCDLGSGTNGTPGSGCTSGCAFECQGNPDCDDNNACNGTETCVSVSSGGGQACQNGSPLSQGDQCDTGPRRICDSGGACVVSTCGDGWVDPGASEQCEPPNTSTCDANCQDIIPDVCGDGSITGAEQCDDGNTSNLDGCDASCNYEPVFRVSTLTLNGGTAPPFCTYPANILGNAISDQNIPIIGGTPRTNLNDILQAGIDDGSTNLLLQTLGLDDLTGVSDPQLEVGVMSGVPDPARGAFPTGTNAMDWDFLVDPADVDGQLLPNARMPSSITARVLDAGPSDIFVTLPFGGTAPLEMRDAEARARISTTLSTPPAPPALASGIVTPEAADGDQAGEGLCGALTVEGLAAVPVPTELTTGLTACQNVTFVDCGGGPVTNSCNSLLDVVVVGCNGLLGVTIMTATQPDVADGDGLQTLTVDSNNHVSSAQTNGNRDAYSVWLGITATRVQITGTQ